jgi:hypothetical protein
VMIPMAAMAPVARNDRIQTPYVVGQTAMTCSGRQDSRTGSPRVNSGVLS